ncbi:MAG: hypothetical protein ACK5O2_09915 [Microthrixaceae bacterium]
MSERPDPVSDPRYDDLTVALGDVLDVIEIPATPGVEVVRGRVRGRVRRRRRRRVTAVSSVLCGLVALAVVAVAVDPGSVSVQTPPAAPSLSVESGDGTTWEWHDDPGIVARDGSESGFAISRGAEIEELVIVLGDSELCADATTCARSTDHFDSAEFEELMETPSEELPAGFEVSPPTLLGSGSPFEGATVVWMPQVTGDMGLGTLDYGKVEGLAGTQHFVGRDNVETLVSRIAAMPFTGQLDRVLVVGTGSGGFAALGNYPAIESAFGEPEVSLLVDTAPWFDPGDLVRRCWANQLVATWGLRLPPGWPEELATGAEAMGNIYPYLADRYPDARLGFMAATDDLPMRRLLAQTSSACPEAAQTGGNLTADDPAAVTPEQYTQELESLFAELELLGPWTTLHTNPSPADLPEERPLVQALRDPGAEDAAGIIEFIDSFRG